MYSGTRISELIVEGPLTGDRLLRVGAALSAAVAAAHARGQVLGALAPSTVFVTADDAVCLLDAASVPISARRDDDLAALGALLYALATGMMPFAASRAASSAGGPPPSPAELNPRLPSGLVQVIRRGVHPEAAQRFASAEEVLAALQEVRRAPGSLESLLPAEHVSSSSRVTPPPRPAPDERDDEEDPGSFEQTRGLPDFD